MKYGNDPYRLFNSDEFKHKSGDNKALYGSVPYVFGHGNASQAAILWLNSAETWVDIFDGSSNFVSESGQLDVVMFVADTPKQLLTKLSEITGFAPLPPIYSLGFHFSKYDETSAVTIMDRDTDFEEKGFPVDVLWLDIGYTEDKI